MQVCVECGEPVSHLFKECSSQTIRLVPCSECNQIADKYVEWETQMVVIDLILNRPQAFRHVIYNRNHLFKEPRGLVKIIIVMIAFDAFDRWYLGRKEGTVAAGTTVFTEWLKPHDNQWLLLGTSVVETSIFLLIQFLGAKGFSRRVRTNQLLSAIVLSSFSKLGVLLWMVWDATRYHHVAIQIFTVVSNMVGLYVILRSRGAAVIIVAVAFLAKKAFAYYMSPDIHFSLI